MVFYFEILTFRYLLMTTTKMNVQNNDDDTDDSDSKQWYQMTTVWGQNFEILTFNKN